MLGDLFVIATPAVTQDLGFCSLYSATPAVTQDLGFCGLYSATPAVTQDLGFAVFIVNVPHLL
jgi:hypothetical protein